MTSLKGKVAWVTGGGRGIGAAIADELRLRGAEVYVTDLNEGKNVEACDISNPDTIHAFAESIVERCGRLDILVNNAGIQRRKVFTDFSIDDYTEIFNTNVRGAFFAAQACAKAMIARERPGSIINICSVNAEKAQPETALYCASKGAVRTMTKALALALGPYEIRVNSVAPGTIATDLNRDRLADSVNVEKVLHMSALRRLGAPKDVAPAVAFPASDDAAYITGATIAVHGGWTLTG